MQKFMKRKNYEVQETNYLEYILPNYKIFLDIGANEGHYTKLANNKMHESKIYSIEANPDLCKNLLAINFKNKNNIFVKNNILSSKSENKNFYINTSDNKTSSIKNIQNSIEVKMNTITLNDLIDKNEKTLVKIDIEGGEFDVFFNNSDYLKNTNIDYLIELHGSGYDNRYPIDILLIFFNNKYNFFKIGRSFFFTKKTKRKILKIFKHIIIQYFRYLAHKRFSFLVKIYKLLK